MSISWPAIDHGYRDPEGDIDLDVYNAALAMLPFAETFAGVVLRDETAGRDLLVKAAARVTRKRAKGGKAIGNLNAYLLTAYKNLVLGECRRQRRFEPLDDLLGGDALLGENFVQLIESEICVRQICVRMDARTREVFEYMVLGYTIEEIGRDKGVRSNGIRSRFSKQVTRLVRLLGGGAEGRSPDDPET